VHREHHLHEDLAPGGWHEPFLVGSVLCRHNPDLIRAKLVPLVLWPHVSDEVDPKVVAVVL
jgi:hypothetical protein